MSDVIEKQVTPLPDLSALVAHQFAALVASGSIEKMIETHLSKSIDEILKSELKDWSDFGKALTEKVKAALQIGSLRDLPNYGQFISTIIAKNVDSQLHGAYAKKLAEDVAAMFVEPPAEITLEQFIEDFKQHVRKNAFGETDHSMTLHIEHSNSSTVIAMDKDSGKERYRCAIRFQVWREDQHIFGLNIGHEDMKKDLFVGPFNEFERKLFRMYVQGTKFIVEPDADRHDFDLTLHDYDD